MFSSFCWKTWAALSASRAPLTFLIKSSSGKHIPIVKRYARSGFASAQKQPRRFRSTHTERNVQQTFDVGYGSILHSNSNRGNKGGKPPRPNTWTCNRTFGICATRLGHIYSWQPHTQEPCKRTQMHPRRSQRRSRSTHVDPNAFPMCPDELSLDTRRSECVSCALRCAFVRRPSIRLLFLCAQTRSHSTRVDPDAIPMS